MINFKQKKLCSYKGTYKKKKRVDILQEDEVAFIAGDNRRKHIYMCCKLPNLKGIVEIKIYDLDTKQRESGGEIDVRTNEYTIGDVIYDDIFNYPKRGNDFITLLDYQSAAKLLEK